VREKEKERRSGRRLGVIRGLISCPKSVTVGDSEREITERTKKKIGDH